MPDTLLPLGKYLCRTHCILLTPYRLHPTNSHLVAKLDCPHRTHVRRRTYALYVLEKFASMCRCEQSNLTQRAEQVMNGSSSPSSANRSSSMSVVVRCTNCVHRKESCAKHNHSSQPPSGREIIRISDVGYCNALALLHLHSPQCILDSFAAKRGRVRGVGRPAFSD
jgi:hypothetical protein